MLPIKQAQSNHPQLTIMQPIIINTQPAYPLYLDKQLLTSDCLWTLCHQQHKHLVIITDDHIAPLYAQPLQIFLQQHQLTVNIISIAHGEAIKTRETKATIEDQLCQLGCGRDTCIIALGGGVVTDLAGFVAATYCRGIPVIYIPTSLLAMVDAAIGGKTAVNTPYGKNLIGTFTQPQAVFLDIDTLSTLPEHEYINAFAEVIKHALIVDPNYFSLLANNVTAIKARNKDVLMRIIKRSCEIKRDIVEADEKETGMRELLNFGHTVGHAIELVTDYHIPHGQAVAIGIVLESYLSWQMGLLTQDSFQSIKTIFTDYGIALTLPNIDTKAIGIEQLKQAMTLDKKSRNKVPRFVLLQSIGKAYVDKFNYATTVDEDKLVQMLHFLVNNHLS